MDTTLILNIAIGTLPVIITLIGSLIRTEHRLTRVETKIELIERCVLPGPQAKNRDT